MFATFLCCWPSPRYWPPRLPRVPRVIPSLALCRYLNFTADSGSNLHHTLYREAKLRTAPPASSSADSAAAKSSAELLQSPSTALPPLTTAEQRVWADAVYYYAAHFADHDLLFSNDLILLKDQLGDFEDCDELLAPGKKPAMPGCLHSSRAFSNPPAPCIVRILGPPTIAPIAAGSLAWRRSSASKASVSRIASPPFTKPDGPAQNSRRTSAFANSAGAYTTLDPLRVTISSLSIRAIKTPPPSRFSSTRPPTASRSPSSKPSFANAVRATKRPPATSGTP